MLRQKRWQREARSGLFQVGDSTETQDSNLTQYQDSSMARDEPPEYQSTGGIHDHGREASPLPTSAADILPVPKIHYPPGVQRDLDAGTPAESIDESMHLIDFADGDRDEVDLLRITTSSPSRTMAGSTSLPSLVHTPDTISSSASPPRHSESPTPSVKSRSGSRHSVSEPHPVADVGALSISDSSGDGSLGPSVSKASTLELPRDAAMSSPPSPPPLLREAAIKEDSDSSESDSSKPGEDPHVRFRSTNDRVRYDDTSRHMIMLVLVNMTGYGYLSVLFEALRTATQANLAKTFQGCV